jgi:uncharacterized protein
VKAKLPQINLLMSVTGKCNLACSYCYVNKKSDVNMPENLLENITKKALNEFKKVIFIWHGTEPTMRGIDFFKSAVEFQKKYSFNNEIENQIQTNLTLFDKNWIKFAKDSGFMVNFSYDGKNANELTRPGSTKQIFNNLSLLQAEGIFPSCNVVISQTNINNLIDINNELTKEHNVSFYMNPAYNYHNKKTSIFIPAEKYAEAVNNMFNYWFNDQNASNTAQNKLCQSLLTSILRIKGVENGKYVAQPASSYNKCTFNHCYGKFLGVLENGLVYPCDNFISEKSCLGHVSSVENLSDFFRKDEFNNLIRSYHKTNEECMQICKWYQLCNSGCPSHTRGKRKDPLCRAYQKIFSNVKSIVDNKIFGK